jgi:hypothetical protein
MFTESPLRGVDLTTYSGSGSKVVLSATDFQVSIHQFSYEMLTLLMLKQLR